MKYPFSFLIASALVCFFGVSSACAQYDSSCCNSQMASTCGSIVTSFDLGSNNVFWCSAPDKPVRFPIYNCVDLCPAASPPPPPPSPPPPPPPPPPPAPTPTPTPTPDPDPPTSDPQDEPTPAWSPSNPSASAPLVYSFSLGDLVIEISGSDATVRMNSKSTYNNCDICSGTVWSCPVKDGVIEWGSQCSKLPASASPYVQEYCARTCENGGGGGGGGIGHPGTDPIPIEDNDPPDTLPPGQGGGNTPPDSTGSTNEDECACDHQLACDLADEYDLYHPGSWGCDKFSFIDADWRPGPTGYEAKHEGYGRITDSVVNGVEQLGIAKKMRYMVVTSGYRCPDGHRALTGKLRSTSQHQYGTAADLNPPEGQWGRWTQDFKDEMARFAVETLFAGYSDNDYTAEGFNHIHVDWGPSRCSPWQTHEENPVCPAN